MRSRTGSPPPRSPTLAVTFPAHRQRHQRVSREPPHAHRSLKAHAARPPSSRIPHGAGKITTTSKATDPSGESAVAPECIGGPPTRLWPPRISYLTVHPSVPTLSEVTPAGQPIQPSAMPATTKSGCHGANIQGWEHHCRRSAGPPSVT